MDRKQKIIVTGASSGIGKEICLALDASGHQVFAAVRKVEEAKTTFASTGCNVIRLDVNIPEEIQHVQEMFEQSPPDILINNAGYGLYGAFEEIAPERFRAQFETNFFGALALTRALLPAMRRQGSGKIVFVSSILGKLVLPTGTAYCSSKWALEGFSMALRYELAPYGIQVSAAEPGLVKTEFKNSTEVPAVAGNHSSPYWLWNEKILSQGYSKLTTRAEKAGKRIARTVLRKKMPVRFTVGWDAFLYSVLIKILPETWLDRIILFSIHRMHSKKKPQRSV